MRDDGVARDALEHAVESGGVKMRPSRTMKMFSPVPWVTKPALLSMIASS